MRAQLKWMSSSDIDLNSFWSDEEDNFGFNLEVGIGIENEDGAEIFSFQVCTPKWMQKHYQKDEIVFIRHVILVFSYDYKEIERQITKLCSNISGDSWKDICLKLSRYGQWEFEDYQDHVS
jgi:Immunity protein 8